MRTVYVHFIVLVEFRVSLRISMRARSEVVRCSQNPDWECEFLAWHRTADDCRQTAS